MCAYPVALVVGVRDRHQTGTSGRASHQTAAGRVLPILDSPTIASGWVSERGKLQFTENDFGDQGLSDCANSAFGPPVNVAKECLEKSFTAPVAPMGTTSAKVFHKIDDVAWTLRRFLVPKEVFPSDAVSDQCLSQIVQTILFQALGLNVPEHFPPARFGRLGVEKSASVNFFGE